MSPEESTIGGDQSLEELRRELAEAREQQAATSEILRVISSSPMDSKLVFAEIAASASRLCDASDAAIHRVDGEVLRLVVSHGSIPKGDDTLPLTREVVTGRAVLDGRTIQVADVQAETGEYPVGSANARRLGHRTLLAIPLMRAGEAIGVIGIRRAEVRPFTDRQIDLLKTFADQAVIAIENTRLFEEVQAQTRNLSIALQRQTATSEILGIISASPGQLEPVFNAILERARELCTAKFGHLLLLDGQVWRAAALHNVPPAYADFWRNAPPAALRVTLLSRLLEKKQPYQVEDLRLSEAYRMRVPLTAATVELAGARTLLGVPLVKDNLVIGAIVLYRTEVHPFDERQIALLSSFTDQAVIAIENTRLFEAEQASKRELQARTRELQESLEQQTAISEILRVISSSPTDIQPVLDSVAERAARICDARIADIFFTEDQKIHVAATFGELGRPVGEPVQLNRSTVMGRSIVDKRPIHVADLQNAGEEFPLGRELAIRFGHRTILAVPLVRDDRALGTILVRRAEVRPFEEQHVSLLTTFADQAAIAIENVRLFNEIVEKSRELEIASQHKSQFVANMSHELRTPLAAILGYAELIQEGFYGALPDKSLDALTRIRSNGKHLLGLINTVLDIAKIESGQFTLNMSEYAIETVVETVRSATESLAQNKKLALKTEVVKSLPIGLGDEQRLTQVLLNLVGNAIKFTDKGEVRVTAKVVSGHFAVSVTDTGPGIPEEHQSRIFEQFHQVDSSNTKAKGGTGLGLAIAKQIVEMHGGRIWVESALGKGSTFQMEIPTSAASR